MYGYAKGPVLSPLSGCRSYVLFKSKVSLFSQNYAFIDDTFFAVETNVDAKLDIII